MIRHAHASDVGAMLPLVRQALDEVRYHEPMTDGLFAMRWLGIMESGHGISIVHEHENQIAGVALGMWSADLFSGARLAVDLLWYVRPDLRREGIGTRLAEEFEAEARRRGCSRVVLGAWERFEPDRTADRLRRAGYEPMERYHVKFLR